MPDVFDAIKERRSVRKYQASTVAPDLVEEILAAAGWAPSAHNAQPWRFIILTDDSVKRLLAEAMAESWVKDMNKDGINVDSNTRQVRVDRFATAPIIILACLTMNGMNKFSDEKRQRVEMDLAMQSFGAAMQNMFLAAQAKGLGACWFCAPGFCKETVRKVLKIPKDVDPEALVIMGYPAEKPHVPTRKPLRDFCFKNKWGLRL